MRECPLQGRRRSGLILPAATICEKSGRRRTPYLTALCAKAYDRVRSEASKTVAYAIAFHVICGCNWYDPS